MGKVAVVGGTSSVGREVIDAIIKRGNHEVTILSRRAERPADLSPVVQMAQVDYNSHSSLVSTFRGIDTVISFATAMDFDANVKLEKSIIDAAIEAGVSRFAPSQWAANSQNHITHYQWKNRVADYLAEVNSKGKVIQYCLFQPGFFADYFAHPRSTTTHFHSMPMLIDFENRRAITVSGCEDAPITITTVADLALTVAAALDYPKPWPEVGGIRGTQTTVREIIALGEKLRGPFEVTRLDAKDVEDHRIETSWYPLIDHPGVPVDMREVVSKGVLREYLLSMSKGEWSVSDEWNKLLDLQLESMHKYLGEVWK
ncbi:hypothetical protein BKA58DRAFT_59086 [Alternaria rosae]|uniref:uncharacterized protein n=1 Tax=Alternaria rosae TaxID=1187941 RepID=UPI001E8D51F1|nr:uncharacterized protein BKA58DRAFT_59086 [Alternaria rosae]KAH6857426.1 hypothetical protein BKA58DRAFT_59086 [Alternaria rosae]